MRYGPPFRYARRPDGRRVAYQVAGDGDLDLVFLLGWPTHLGLMWENPSLAGFLGKLSSFSRLLLYDRTGNGLSDRGPGGYVFETRWTTSARSWPTPARSGPRCSAAIPAAGSPC